jgi:hypothetical protein
VTSPRTLSALAILQVIALSVFFYSIHIGDSFLPERGGNGDGGAIYLWNTRADLAFGALAGLWLTALVLAIRTARRGGVSYWRALSQSPKGLQALAVVLPVCGLLAGYIVLAF